MNNPLLLLPPTKAVSLWEITGWCYLLLHKENHSVFDVAEHVLCKHAKANKNESLHIEHNNVLNNDVMKNCGSKHI